MGMKNLPTNTLKASKLPTVKVPSGLREGLTSLRIKKQEVKITGMWAVINKKNSSNAMHIHSNNYISAAYYVKAPKNCGDIVFYDPRFAATYRYPKISKTNKLNSNIVSFQPKEGMLVLFPSYLQHSVNANKTDEERIVISFNINLI